MDSGKKRMGKFFYEKDEESGEEFVVYPSVPIFDEHEGEDGTVYDREVLAHIAQNNNDRIEDTNDLCPIVGWHTPQEDEYDPDKDPPIIGWAEQFRVEDFGNKRPRGCIFCTFKIYKKFHDYFKSHPRRSVEIWPEDDPKQRYIDPIAVLAGVTPKRDLGYLYAKSTSAGPEVLEPMRYSQKNQSSKLKYEMSYPGGGNTYVPGGTERKKNSRADSISVQYEQSFSELDRQLQSDLFGYEGTHGQAPYKAPSGASSFMSGMASSLMSDMKDKSDSSKTPPPPPMEVPDADVSDQKQEGVKAEEAEVPKNDLDSLVAQREIEATAEPMGAEEMQAQSTVPKPMLEVEQNDKPGPKDPRRTKAPKKDQVKGSDKNPKGSASKENEKIDLSDKTESSLKKKMESHNKKGKGSDATLGALKSVWRRGAGAYSSSHAPKMSRSGWAMARVNAFLELLEKGKPSNSDYTQDYDLLPSGHPKKSKNQKQTSDSSGFKYAKQGNDVTSQLMGEPTMALSDQEMGQIVQGVETLVQDLLQRELPGLIQKAQGEEMPEDNLAKDEAVAESMDAEEGVLDEVIMGDDMPEQNAKKSKDDEDEDEKEKHGMMYGDKEKNGMMYGDKEKNGMMYGKESEDHAKDSEDHGKDSDEKEMYGHCGKENYEEEMKMAKMMFAKACNSYKLDSDSADIEGAKQYMASLEDSDKESISRYVSSTESSDQEKQLYSKVSVKTESSEQYSKAKREAKAYYQKKLQQETIKYQKVQQANRKLMDEIVSMKSDLVESRKKERYSKISSRLADLEKDGYCFDREKEVSFCMNLTDDQVNEHISERIPMHYAKAPFGDMIPVVESERITPAPTKSEKYAKAASDATITLRDGGLRGLKYKKVLDWMCENDTDRTPSSDELGY